MKQFITRCVEAEGQEILDYVETRKDISVATFKKHIGKANFLQLEIDLGYKDESGRNLLGCCDLSKDRCVNFGKGKFRGKSAVDCTWSLIEHIFA